MNRIFYLLGALLLLGACHKSPESLSEMKNASTADSLMYYYGQFQANTYWQDAESDTMLRSQEARDEFMRGFREGLKLDSDNEAYNKGVQLGLRLALRLREYQELYDMTFPEDVLANSLELGLENDTMVNVLEAQRAFYGIRDRLEFQKADKELAKATEELAQQAKAKGYVMVSDTLAAKDITAPSRGPRFKEGEKIEMQLTASTIDGREVGKQFPNKITLGEGKVKGVVKEAIKTMTDGQTRAFMTTPRALFGKQYTRYQLMYNEPVMFTIKASRLGSDESTDNTPQAELLE